MKSVKVELDGLGFLPLPARSQRYGCWRRRITPLSDTAERDDVVGAWLSLPRRIYLDTSTLQKLYEFGGEIFEGEPFEPVGGAARLPGLADEIDALRMIFMVNERGMFEFAVTEANLREVVNRTHPGYTQWVYDVLDTWLIQSEGEAPPGRAELLRTGVSA